MNRMTIEHPSPDEKTLPLNWPDPRLSRREILRYGLYGAGAALLAGRTGRAPTPSRPRPSR